MRQNRRMWNYWLSPKTSSPCRPRSSNRICNAVMRWRRPLTQSCAVSLNGLLFQAKPARMLTFKKLRRVLLVTSLLFCGAYLYFVVPTFHANLVEPPVPLDVKVQPAADQPQEVAPSSQILKLRSGVSKSNEDRDRIKPEQSRLPSSKENSERPWFFQNGIKRPLPGERGWWKSFEILWL